MRPADDRRLHDYVDGRLRGDELAEFERRLARDDELARAVAACRAIGDALRDELPDDRPAPGLATRVRARVDERVRPPRRAPWEAWGLAAASLVLAAVFVPLLIGRGEPADGVADREAPTAFAAEAAPEGRAAPRAAREKSAPLGRPADVATLEPGEARIVEDAAEGVRTVLVAAPEGSGLDCGRASAAVEDGAWVVRIPRADGASAGCAVRLANDERPVRIDRETWR